jgi:nucleoside-diphosphate kinase
MVNREVSYIMIKPDGVQRGLVGQIIARFEAKGFKLVALKMVTPTKELLEQHYEDLNTKPFFGGLIEYMMMGPVVAMVWEGDNVVLTGRKLLGGELNIIDILRPCIYCASLSCLLRAGRCWT